MRCDSKVSGLGSTTKTAQCNYGPFKSPSKPEQFIHQSYHLSYC